MMADLDKRRLQVMDLFFHQEIAGYGSPMRKSSDSQLRKKEIAGYGPLQRSD